MIVDYVEAIIEESKRPPFIEGRNEPQISIPHAPQEQPKKKSASQLDEEKRTLNANLSAKSSSESRKKAQIYVLLLIENTVIAPQLQQMLKNISSVQYDDVCLERCLSGVCGFPLCSQPYQDSYGERNYVIRSNNVYNVDRRRNFCSNICFEASQIVRLQISSTPLYLRQSDSDQTSIKMPDMSVLHGLHGEVMDIRMAEGIEKKSKKPKKNMKDVEDVACIVEDFAIAGLLSTADDDQDNKDEVQGLNIYKNGFDHYEDPCKILDSNNDEMFDMSESQTRKNNKSKGKSSFKAKNRSKSDYNVQDKKNKKLVSNMADLVLEGARSKKSVEEQDKLHCWKVVQQVEARLSRWLGWEALVLVMGERYVREVLTHHGMTHTGPLTVEGDHSSLLTSRYVSLCGRIRQQELLEELESMKEITPRPAKEVPKMDQIMDDFESMNLKVKSYYKGEESLANGSNVEVSEMSNRLKGMTVSNSQVDIWRSAIIMEKLDPHLPKVVESLGLSVHRIRPLLTNLVDSLNLEENLHLKPIQWELLTLLLLKLLSVRYPVIHSAFKNPDTVKRELDPSLTVFQLDVGYLDRVLAHFTQADAILKAFNDSGLQSDKVNIA